MKLRQLRIIEHKWQEHVAFLEPKGGGVCLELRYKTQLMIYIAISGSLDIIRTMCTSHFTLESRLQSSEMKNMVILSRAHEGEEPPSQEPIKTLVFSQWNGMLDLVELCFVENGIEFRRLDGTMSLAARDRAVKEFSNDPDVSFIIFFFTFTN